jgi:RND superfamily putative drug exporter
VSLVLVGTVILSFFATLGVCAFLFNSLLGFTNVDPNYTLFAFIFLVALGVDYNIFLMTRVREESLTLGTREGMLRGLAVTGGVITSAGVVLAATFAVLATLPITPLFQIGVTVAIGVLLDTIIVRSVLVPAITLDMGRRIWWPSQLWRTDGGADRTDEEAQADSGTEGDATIEPEPPAIVGR